MRAFRIAAVMVATLVVDAATAQRLIAVGRLDSERNSSSEYWRDVRHATTAEMVEAHKGLRRYLALRQDMHSSGDPFKEISRAKLRDRLGDYVLQMASVLALPGSYDPTAGRPRHILMQGICKDEASKMGPRLSSELVTIADGGDCFFDARFDLRSREIVYLAVHGMG